MLTFFKRVFVVCAVIIVMISGVFIYRAVCDKIERERYPLNYTQYVEEASEEYSIPKEIIYAVIKTESDFRSDAVSKAGAIGLMQIIPDTFEWLQFKNGEDIEHFMLNDPKTNIRYGTYLLSLLYEEFGIWDTVYAAYNAGIGRVKGWLDDEKYTKNGKLYYIPFNETARYIVKVNEAAETYKRLYFF